MVVEGGFEFIENLGEKGLNIFRQLPPSNTDMIRFGFAGFLAKSVIHAEQLKERVS